MIHSPGQLATPRLYRNSVPTPGYLPVDPIDHRPLTTLSPRSVVTAEMDMESFMLRMLSLSLSLCLCLCVSLSVCLCLCLSVCLSPPSLPLSLSPPSLSLPPPFLPPYLLPLFLSLSLSLILLRTPRSRLYYCRTQKDLCLTPSLPQPVKVPCSKIYTHTAANSIFSGPVTI